jgi:hypothetical protein
VKPSNQSVRIFIYDEAAPPPRNEKSSAAPVGCSRCGSVFVPRKPWQTFCSPRCRLAAFRASQERETHGMTYPSGAPKINAVSPSPIQDPPENTHAFHSPKQGGSLLQHVLEIEVFGGRDRRPGVSSDGTPYEVSRLRPRTLLNRNRSGN